MRAVTRTNLALGDLHIPIGVCPATGSDDIRFDTAAPDGTKRHTQYVHESETRTLRAVDDPAAEPIEVPKVLNGSIKGVRIGEDFREVPPSELDYAKAVTAMPTIELLEVIDYRRVPTERMTGGHWIQPDKMFERSLAILIEALRRDGHAMLVKWSARDRQRLGIIRVRVTDDGPALMLNDVTFAAQLRKPNDQVLAAGRITELDERSVNAAQNLLAQYRGPGRMLDEATDDLIAVHTDLVQNAHQGVYEDPAQTLAFAASLHRDGLRERADRLVQWAEARWPQVAAARDEIDRVIAAAGDDTAEQLATLVAA